MNYNDDGYAAMLLTMALSPDREEYARPFSFREYHRLEMCVRDSRYRRMGALLKADISGLMLYLDLSEAEALRAFTLLQRTVQLSYALEGFGREGIDVVTCCDADYPDRLRLKLRESAPAFFYRCGEASLIERSAIAITGISGIRTEKAQRQAVMSLVRAAVQQGYAIVTSDEMGLSRLAAQTAIQEGGTVLSVLGGGLRSHVGDEANARQIAMGNSAAITTEHPDAPFNANQRSSRNRILFALADAAFVFSTDGRRSEAEALANHYCDWIYAWEQGQDCAALISKGAKPLKCVDDLDFEGMRQHWSSSGAAQMSIFDLL